MNQRGFSKTLIIVLALVIITGIVGYVAFFQKQRSTPATSTSPTPSLSPQTEKGSGEKLPSPSVALKFNPDIYKYPFFAKIANQLINRLK